ATFGNLPFGRVLAFITILSEGGILIVAAQAGFIDGPRIMANMAVDSWFPHRFASLSERLTTHNGILFMGLGAMFILITTGGSVAKIVVMYSINVFLTFSLSEFGMARFYVKHRGKEEKWRRHLAVHLTGLTLCVTILIVTVIEKFTEGGWETLLITCIIIGVCHMIRSHYDKVTVEMGKFDSLLRDIPMSGKTNEEPLNPRQATAIQLVNDFNGFGVHTFLSIVRNFPNLYKNFIFVSVAVIDFGSFKGAEEVHNLEESVKKSLEKYVEFARQLGLPADYRYETGTDIVEEAVNICGGITKEFQQSTVFTGQLTFRLEKFYHKVLHNETAFAIQRHLQWNGITTVILPVRIGG
ncbi:MAG: amino acid permease, partial [Deltaproteobacteria bacterium]|nr:amino acid permease [Deltaproteobacteria bacterium]